MIFFPLTTGNPFFPEDATVGEAGETRNVQLRRVLLRVAQQAGHRVPQDRDSLQSTPAWIRVGNFHERRPLLDGQRRGLRKKIPEEAGLGRQQEARKAAEVDIGGEDARMRVL